VARDQALDFEFACRVKTLIRQRRLLPEQAIGADDLIFGITLYGVVENQEMVSDGVEGIDVATATHCVCRKPGTHLFDEDAEADLLGCVDFTLISGEACFEGADTTKDVGFPLFGSWQNSAAQARANNAAFQNFRDHGESPRHRLILAS